MKCVHTDTLTHRPVDTGRGEGRPQEMAAWYTPTQLIGGKKKRKCGSIAVDLHRIIGYWGLRIRTRNRFGRSVSIGFQLGAHVGLGAGRGEGPRAL